MKPDIIKTRQYPRYASQKRKHMYLVYISPPMNKQKRREFLSIMKDLDYVRISRVILTCSSKRLDEVEELMPEWKRFRSYPFTEAGFENVIHDPF